MVNQNELIAIGERHKKYVTSLDVTETMAGCDVGVLLDETRRLYNALEQIATNEAHDENEYSIEDWKGLVHDLRNCARQAIAQK